jgi:putative phosphoesterase
MKRIGLISDTHSMLSKHFLEFFKDVDEIWHAGDIGDYSVIRNLEKIAPVRAVWGNIDHGDCKNTLQEDLLFQVEEVKVLMTHIGGYPGRYQSRIRKLIIEHKPQLYIAGHSHILKVMYDQKLDCLHMNPGAAGNQGYHKVATALRFTINKNEIKELDIFEIDRKKLRNSHFK